MRCYRDEKLTKVASGQTRNYIAGIEYLGANLDEISFLHRSKPGRSGYVCLVTTPSRAQKYKESDETYKNLPRSLLTFHELYESYQRTEKGVGYNSAHNSSLEAEKAFYATPLGYLKSGIHEIYDGKKLKN